MDRTRSESQIGPRRSMGSRIGSMVFAILTLASCSTANGSHASTTPGATGSQGSDVHIFAASDCPELTCQGYLTPGAYRSTILDPTIDFEITSPGWTWDFSAGGFRILADASHEDGFSPDGIYFLRKPAIASQDCEEATEPGVGRSVSEIVAWLEAAPGLAISAPRPVTIGGLDGEQLDLQLDPKWKRPCFWSDDQPAVPLLFRGAAIGGYNWAMIPMCRCGGTSSTRQTASSSSTSKIAPAARPTMNCSRPVARSCSHCRSREPSERHPS